jgi:hypothetical protein
MLEELGSTAGGAEALESSQVHAVYEAIGAHFSDTRQRPWPVVDAFLKCVTSSVLSCGKAWLISSGK